MASFSSVFTRVFDVAVLGSGYAGLAAALQLRAQGRTVLLIGPRGDLAWESGRSFFPNPGASTDPLWTALANRVAQLGGALPPSLREGQGEGASDNASASMAQPAFLDGALAEIVATDLLLHSGVETLYYAHPVAVERNGPAGNALAALIVGTKAGSRRVVARQWIDATEQGDLLRLCDPAAQPRTTNQRTIHLYLQHANWPKTPSELTPTPWPTERCATAALEGDAPWREQLLTALARLEQALPGVIAEASMSHCSVEPIASYDAAPASAVSNLKSQIPNLSLASPAFSNRSLHTLADRFTLGLDAVQALASLSVHEPRPSLLTEPIPAIAPTQTLDADVLVAGAGTGGALAAIAAARGGAKVVCIDPLAFPGGIGAGGGIHSYYFGVTGGLQQELDRRTRDLMKRFGGGPLGDGPFNPEAKKIALDQMLREAGVTMLYDALLYAVHRTGNTVAAADVAYASQSIRVRAKAFIDATGDADLAAMAGAPFTFGREHDGLPHAYSQSSGKLRDLHGRPRMAIVNFDAGFCDPTDPEDLTRARLTAIRQYLLPAYTNLTRPTYLAPAIGLRQARQVQTDYVLTLADQIARRTFDDAIGYTGCHYDNHAADYEWESDEALFWVWFNRQWRTPFACEMSYRQLLPKGLSNVWIACRAFGVSQDAHHSCRMQRDLQRAGEAAGWAAALAVQHAATSRSVPMKALQARLTETGALKLPESEETIFDKGMGSDQIQASLPGLDAALDAIDRGEFGQHVWLLYQSRAQAYDAIVQRLNSPSLNTSWIAAGVLAMWSDPIAEPRLIQAIESREYGFDDITKDDHHAARLAPNWLVAVSLLRRVGSARCLDALESLAGENPLGLSVATGIALTLEQLSRHGAAGPDRVARITDRLLAARVVGEIGAPQRWAGPDAERIRRGDLTQTPLPPSPPKSPYDNTADDLTWQRHLAIARARLAAGLPIQPQAHHYRADPRALVRRAFSALQPAQTGTLA